MLQRHRKGTILVLLGLAVMVSLALAFVLRFDFAVPSQHRDHAPFAFSLALLLKLAVFFVCGLHHGWWAWTDTRDLIQIVKVNFLASLAFTTAMLLHLGVNFPRSIYVLDFLICLFLIGGMRMTARIAKEIAFSLPGSGGGKELIIYGAGQAGASLAREIRLNPQLRYRVVGFLDDDPYKMGYAIAGHRVLGGGRDIVLIVGSLKRRGLNPEEVIISMPSATGRQVREAVAACRACGLKCRILPGVESLLLNQGLAGQVREIALEDLLGREPVHLDKGLIMGKLAGKRILVTGAAGSIGSVLCQQIASFRPSRLILFDQSESELFRIDLDLRSRFPDIKIVPIIGDICNVADLHAAIQQQSIHAIFHAAAYKHVPLMESHVVTAVQNNVIGTWNVARAAQEHGVESFVMISSDKAVNPTNIMGATKRAAERIVSSLNTEETCQTRFVSVRFGNVLGSSGSVVPTFRRQIASGGPVTVTHPEVRRYFMLTEEAVQLVLQASSMGHGGEIFVLDMGELIRISDLAVNMIRLAGLTPHEDIEIRYVGLRPGEKLYEEVISQDESTVPTSHDRIKIFLGPPLPHAVAHRWIEKLGSAIQERDELQAIRLLLEIVPEYQGSDSWKAHLVGQEASNQDLPEETMPGGSLIGHHPPGMRVHPPPP
jgi:FlaA1/EpsC-like NDP-sugar epimerase